MDQKNCRNCQKIFVITDDDKNFYGRMRVPSPTLCPDCRAQRRWAFRNQYNLYHRKCDFSGKEIISLYSQDKPYKIYDEEIWWSDKWNALDYGRDFDFSRPFFEQFNELLLAVPRRSMNQDGTNENCKYITFGMANKNCYLAFACFYSEDVYYSTGTSFSKDCLDSFRCTECQLVYECSNSHKCYQCAYLNDCSECLDSYLLTDCKNCKSCIACKNLRNKEFHIYNKPASKEEFEAFKMKLLEEETDKYIKEFNEWELKLPTIFAHIQNSENCTGNYIENAHNCYYCFDVLMGAQDLKYCFNAGWKGKDMMDCHMAGKESDLLYEMHATTNAHNSAFCSLFRGGSDCYYCDNTSSTNNCFGCTGLVHKDYCILNKQYSKEDYLKLLPRIIEHMQKTGEWGEFFPAEISPFAYNETMANDYYEMPKEEVLAKGWKWKEKESKEREVANANGELLTCKTCQKPYKIISQEEILYQKIGVNKPKECYECRLKRRFNARNPYKLWERQCAKCGSPLFTSYSPERKDIIYCEKCYLAEVY
ncbi:MAG: hypothetical protein WC846_03075 [Candidatus Gracilibacteria bacterium]|jgi:hypothetical protein